MDVDRYDKTMKCEFEYVNPDDLHRVWDDIRAGLVITQKKAPSGWIPEDVYLSLKKNESVLHIGKINGEYAGFVISLTLSVDSVKKLLLWIVYSCHCNDGSNGILAANIDQLREWGRNVGAAKIQFNSPRKGWEKIADKVGFKKTVVIYECDA